MGTLVIVVILFGRPEICQDAFRTRRIAQGVQPQGPRTLRSSHILWPKGYSPWPSQSEGASRMVGASWQESHRYWTCSQPCPLALGSQVLAPRQVGCCRSDSARYGIVGLFLLPQLPQDVAPQELEAPLVKRSLLLVQTMLHDFTFKTS